MVHIIAAVGKDRGIGKKGELPWHIPDDLKRFKGLTLGHPVIMGRTTFESIVKMLGKPLPGRTNIVMVRAEESWEYPGIVRASSMEDALHKGKEIDSEVFVIGGAQIYTLALPHADILNLTRVHAACDECDAFFPPFEEEFKTVVSRTDKEQAGLTFSFEDRVR